MLTDRPFDRSCSPRRARLPGLLVIAIATVLGVVPGLPVAGDELPRRARELLDVWESRIGDDSNTIVRILRQYSQLEEREVFTAGVRHAIHDRLRSQLRKAQDAAWREAATEIIGRGDDRHEAAQIVVIKELRRSSFPASDEKRLDWLAEKARSSNERIARWAVHALGDTRRNAAVGVLLSILREEEEADRRFELRWHLVGSELYRVLGRHAISRDSRAIERQWDELGRKLPESPDYSLDEDSPTTTGFFGDLVSPRSVFLIDSSSSMRQQTVLKRQRTHNHTSTGGERDSGPREPKIEIVRRELMSALRTLREGYRFNVVAYSAELRPWRQPVPRSLYSVGESTLRSALEFARTLEIVRGTNIHDAAAAALSTSGVDTVYLLSDGVPSVGGDKSDVVRAVEDGNYLDGYRIITYGFQAEKDGSYDEDFMRKLAADNWGWYRRLN